MDEEAVCVSCKSETSGAHKCQDCGLHCHVICGTPVGEEGYGQAVVCPKCSSKLRDTAKAENEQNIESEQSASNDIIIVDEKIDGLGESILPTTIPPNLYKAIPGTGQYIVEMMEFCGYSDVDSVLRLREPEERNKMFDFMRDMAETMGDEDKKKLFGIFWKIPHKVRMLPGVEHRFNQFLKEVEILKNPIKQSKQKNKQQRDHPDGTQSSTQNSYKKTTNPVSADTLTFQLKKWMNKRGCTAEFSIINSGSSFKLSCEVCNHSLVLSNGTLTNAHRHYAKGKCEKIAELQRIRASSKKIDSMFSQK